MRISQATVLLNQTQEENRKSIKEFFELFGFESYMEHSGEDYFQIDLSSSTRNLVIRLSQSSEHRSDITLWGREGYYPMARIEFGNLYCIRIEDLSSAHLIKVNTDNGKVEFTL